MKEMSYWDIWLNINGNRLSIISFGCYIKCLEYKVAIYQNYRNK